MNITAQEIIHDLITCPGLGMFIWLCVVFFLIALVFFVWALKSGQLSDLEKSKFEMFDDSEKKEINHG